MKKEYYMAYEDRYKDAYKNNTLWETSKPTKEVINTIKELNICVKDKILEVGCGEGRDALYLLDKGYNVTAIDYSKSVIEKCNELSNNKYKDNFKSLDIIKDTLNNKYNFIYSVAVLHMFIKKVHRDKFYNFIYEHLIDNGIALIITMGDGINTYKSNTKDAFKKVNRININTGKQIKVAMTSCCIIDTNTLAKEINDNNLEIIKTWISEDIPNFDKCICTLIKKNYLLKIINDNNILNNNMKYIKINKGFTNTIYTLDNKYIIKICSNKDNKERFNNEINFYLSNKNNKYIPKLYNYYISNNDKDYSYEIIELVKGKTLYSIWHTLSIKERKHIIKEITNIMKSIHTIKGDYYNFSKYLKDKLNTNINIVKDLFTNKEIELYNRIINNIDEYFKDKDLRLVHSDIHFDNILIDSNNNIKIIDFERSIIAPIDYELDIFLRMCNNPTKYASEEDSKYIDINDYKDIPIYLKEYYPEIYNFNNFNIRHLIYDLEVNLRLLPRFKDNIELKDKVVEIIYRLDKEMENNNDEV